MVRKQLYLEETQDRSLKRQAKKLGISEAELVRRALDDALKQPVKRKSINQGDEVLSSLFADADTIAKTHRFAKSYRFDRQSLAEEDERQSRYS
jgi:hypothetical protein